MTILRKPNDDILNVIEKSLSDSLVHLENARNKANFVSPEGFSDADYINNLYNLLNSYLLNIQNIIQNVKKTDNNFNSLLSDLQVNINNFNSSDIKYRDRLIK